MPDEVTLLERARAARRRKRSADVERHWERDERSIRHELAAVNLLLDTSLTTDDLQVWANEDGGNEYRFEVEGYTFSLSGSNWMTVYGPCEVDRELLPVGRMSLSSITMRRQIGEEYSSAERDTDLAKLADLLEATPVCEEHGEQPATVDDLIREIVREEIEAAGLAHEDHDHSDLADADHAHYELADKQHTHSEYADEDHEHY